MLAEHKQTYLLKKLEYVAEIEKMHVQGHFELQNQIKNDFVELWKNSPEFQAFTQRMKEEDEKKNKWITDILERFFPKTPQPQQTKNKTGFRLNRK